MKPNAKLILPLAVVAAGAALAAVIGLARPEVERETAPPPPPLVRVVEAVAQDVRLNVVSQGTVEPATRSTLSAQVAGRIEGVDPSFAEGGFFRRGQVLVRIESADYRLAANQAEAVVAQARVRLEREEAESDLARQEWAELGEGDAPPLTRREPQLAEARAGLAGAEAALEQARLQLGRTEVRALFDGRVRAKHADVGQYVAPGAPLAEIFATERAVIRVAVARTELGFLDLDLGRGQLGADGPMAVVTAELAGSVRRWDGRVTRLDSSFDPRTRMLGLWVEVEDPYGLRRPRDGAPLAMGLFVEAEIAGRVAAGVVVLPRAALRDGDRVIVVDAESRLRRRDVSVLRALEDRVVLSGGLAPGELICVSPLEAFVEGMAVRTASEPALPATDLDREEAL